MKRFLSLLICTMAVLGLCSCRSGNTNSEISSSAGTSKNSEVKSEPQNTSKKVSVADLEKHAETPGSDFSYDELTRGSIVITKYNGSDNVVVVPERIDGKRVEKIGTYVFANGSTVIAVKLPDSLKEINNYVFINNSNLQSVIMGDGLETIPESAFSNTGLSDIKLGSNVKTIEKMSFTDCENLKTIYIPENVQKIGAFLFGVDRSKDVIIQGESGSVAETYAKENNLKFKKNN